MPDKTLAERLPGVLPAHDDSTDFAVWLDAHDAEAERHVADLEDVKKSLQIAHATGDELGRLGADFGVLGKRRGRGDQSYRQYLMTLVQAYQGRGTVPGLKKAIAAGVLTNKSDVEITEDFTANKYEVRLLDWTAHRTGVVRELAELADPSVIALRDPIDRLLDVGEAIGGGDGVEYATPSVGNLSAAEFPDLSTGDVNLSKASQLPTQNRIKLGVATGTAGDVSSSTVRTEAISSTSMGNLSSGSSLA